MTYQTYYNRITNHGGKIINAEKNSLIVWDNPTGTIRRIDSFDAKGEFEGRQVIRLK